MPVSCQPPWWHLRCCACCCVACCPSGASPAAAYLVGWVARIHLWADMSCFLHPAAGRLTRSSATHQRQRLAPTDPARSERGPALLPRCSMPRRRCRAAFRGGSNGWRGLQTAPQPCGKRQQLQYACMSLLGGRSVSCRHVSSGGDSRMAIGREMWQLAAVSIADRPFIPCSVPVEAGKPFEPSEWQHCAVLANERVQPLLATSAVKQWWHSSSTRYIYRGSGSISTTMHIDRGAATAQIFGMLFANPSHALLSGLVCIVRAVIGVA